MSDQARSIYSLRDVGVEFPTNDGQLRILSDVTVDIAPGEILGIVGRSGTGKTTLLRVLGGLISASDGVVELEGKKVNGPCEGAVTVFQDYGNALLPWRSVEKNVSLGLERKVSGAERRERIRQALDLVGLSGRESDHPWRLSGGMQQRVQIARALAMRPSVMLMDEPFGALDAMTKANLQDELLAVQKETEATIVFITHDLEEAIYLSDRVLVISGMPGRISLSEQVPLPRPRDQIATREHPDYLRIRHSLGVALRSEAALGDRER